MVEGLEIQGPVGRLTVFAASISGFNNLNCFYVAGGSLCSFVLTFAGKMTVV